MSTAYCFHSDRLTKALNCYAVKIAREQRRKGFSRRLSALFAAHRVQYIRAALTSPEAIKLLTVQHID